MSTVKPRIASGFPEYLPQEQIEFQRLVGIITSVYERYGFAPIDTPDLELRDVLLAKGGGETEQQVYEFTRGKNDFVMRFDLTVPLARYAAQHEGELVFPFRRYHIGKVHRAERAQAGRFREFYQCDIDIIGTKSPTSDAEIPAIIHEVFTRLDFGAFTIRVNNRKVLNGFFASLGLAERKAEILRLVDKSEKISAEALASGLSELGVDSGQQEKLQAFLRITGAADEVLERLAALGITDEEFTQGLEELRELVRGIRAFGVPESGFAIDLKIARGLDYYTGTVYETVLDAHPELGSICSGGRYDNLAEHYTGTHLPGVGISIGLSRLFYKLRELGIIEPAAKTPAAAIVLPMDERATAYAIEVSAALRAGGLNTLLYTEGGALKKKLRYANQLGVRYAIVLGETETTERTLSIKDMQSGESQTVPFDKIPAFIENSVLTGVLGAC
ncbi:MAG: histidine--tRNA ligase [Clostridiales Family XIII bacterium]|jgi:histidyl-tRNA synthetase|nr:histidine--tRNA ligase [Clostridiales Family XIII bacterium]